MQFPPFSCFSVRRILPEICFHFSCWMSNTADLGFARNPLDDCSCCGGSFQGELQQFAQTFDKNALTDQPCLMVFSRMKTVVIF